MVFFIFGPTYESWAIGNHAWTFSKNLPDSCQELFDEQTVNGANIDFAAISPNNLCYISVHGGGAGLYASEYGAKSSYRSENPNLLADLNTSAVGPYGYGFGARTVDHISFSSGGGWFIRYSDRTVRLSMIGTFPEKFHETARPYMQTHNWSSPQQSDIKYVFFGAGDTFLIQCWDGSTTWYDIPEILVDSIKSYSSQGLILGKATVLCPWDSRFFFAEFESEHWLNEKLSYSWNIWPNGHLTDLVVREVLEGMMPVSYKAAVPVDMPPPLAASSKKPGPKPPTPSPPQQQKPASSLKPASPSIQPSSPASRPTSAASTSKPGNPFRKPKNPFAEKANEPDWSDVEPEHRALLEKTFHDSEPFEGAGYITGEAAVKIFKILGEGLTLDRLAKIWDQADSNEDGQLNLSEFACAFKMMTDLDEQKEKQMTRSGSKIVDNLIDLEPDGGLPSDLLPAYALSAAAQPQTTSERTPPVTSRRINTPLICSLCCSTITDVAHSCSTCENGEFDMCKSCQFQGRSCPGRHKLQFVKIELGDDLTDQMNNMSLNNRKPNPDNSVTDTESGRQGDDKQLKDSLIAAIVTEKPNVKWEDVAGLEAAKEDLQEAVILPIKFPQLFTGERKAKSGMLLYGPPGTGKSFLAKAIATEVDSTLFSISSSDVMSKWMGDSERLIKLLFQLAREKKPSIIFIDEIDSLCSSRSSSSTSSPHLSGLKTELLVQMDGVGNNNTGVLVLGATNLPWTLDPAIRRRFQSKIHIPLPDDKARRQLFKRAAGKAGLKGLGKKDLEVLGRKTEGFSGSDLAGVVQEALMVPVRKVKAATHYKQIEADGKKYLTPCSPDDESATAMSWRDVPRRMLKEPDVLVEDLYAVLEKAKPSVAQEDVDKCAEWTEKFGREGA